MSKLDELIQELCPDGVKFYSLDSVCEIRSGWGFPNAEQGRKEGQFPFFKVGDMNNDGNEMYMYTANNYISKDTVKKLKCNPAPKGTIIFPKIGAAIGTNKKRILITDSCYDNNIMGLIAGNNISPHFLFYIMHSVDLMSFTDSTGAVPSIRKSTLAKFTIPVPPLEVQREIVRILDNFTELAAELTAELAARKKQYEYYRDRLFELIEKLCPDGVITKPLGEFVNFLNGRAYKQSELLDSGKYKVLRVGNFYTNNKWYYSNLELDEDKYCDNGDLLYTWAATFGPQIWDGEKVIYHYHIWKLKFDESILNKKYLYYFLVKDIDDISKSLTQSTMPHVSMASMKKRMVSIPPLKVQREIVRILDNFTELTAELTAELAARKKQYEYYRDKLLTFKRAENQSEREAI